MKNWITAISLVLAIALTGVAFGADLVLKPNEFGVVELSGSEAKMIQAVLNTPSMGMDAMPIINPSQKVVFDMTGLLNTSGSSVTKHAYVGSSVANSPGVVMPGEEIYAQSEYSIHQTLNVSNSGPNGSIVELV